VSLGTGGGEESRRFRMTASDVTNEVISLSMYFDRGVGWGHIDDDAGEEGGIGVSGGGISFSFPLSLAGESSSRLAISSVGSGGGSSGSGLGSG